jgi:hypothetical protein
MGANHINELIFPTTYALELVTEFKLKINGHWCGKYRMRDIKNLDEKFHFNIINSIQQVYGNNNKKPLVNLIKSLLRNNLVMYHKINPFLK